MAIVECPNCTTRVFPTDDGFCPSCRKSISKLNSLAGDNPYVAPALEIPEVSHFSGMTTPEQIYTAFVILLGMFFLVGVAVFHFMIIPTAKEPRFMYLAVSMIWIFIFAVVITTFINLYHRSLLLIPTIIQCVLLILGIYFAPIGIWGLFLLRYRNKRQTNSHRV